MNRHQITIKVLVLVIAIIFCLTNCSHETVDESKQLQSVEQIISNVKVIRETQPDRAMSLVEKALMLALDQNDVKGQADLLRHRAFLFEKQKNHVQAIYSYQKAFGLYEKINDLRNQSKCANGVGYNYYKRSLNTEASKWLSMSERLCSEVSDSTLLHLNYANQGLNFLETSQRDKSVEYFKKSLALSLSFNVPEDIATSYNNIGYALGESKDYVNSMTYTNAALAIGEKNNLEVQVANAYNNLGYYQYFLQGKYKESIPYYLKAIEHAQDNDYKINTLYNLAMAYVKLKNFAEAELFFNQTIALARKIKNREAEINTNRALADSFRLSGSAVLQERATTIYNQLYELENVFMREQKEEIQIADAKASDEKDRAQYEQIATFRKQTEGDLGLLKNLLTASVIIIGVLFLWFVLHYLKNLRRAFFIEGLFEKNAKTVHDIVNLNGTDANMRKEISRTEIRLVMQYIIQSANYAAQLRKELRSPWVNQWKKFKNIFSARPSNDLDFNH